MALVRAVRKYSIPVEAANAEAQDFNLLEVIRKLKLPVHESALLNWGRFESVYRMGIEDVSKWLSYLWYPSSDDLEILDSCLEWAISIAHSGELYSLRLGHVSQSATVRS